MTDIAQLAGLTPRTSFHHFADKREVLFAGSEILRDRMVDALGAAAAIAAPAEAGIAVFRVAFERWLTAAKARSLTTVMLECVETLAALTSTDA